MDDASTPQPQPKPINRRQRQLALRPKDFTARRRDAKGRLLPGYSGNPTGGVDRARRHLNSLTIEGMRKAFAKGGQRAIDKVMKDQPAIFLKMLVLLVPRELQVEHSGSVKEMTDQQIEDAIAAIKAMIAEREAGMIDVTPTTSSVEAPESDPDPAKPLE